MTWAFRVLPKLILAWLIISTSCEPVRSQDIVTKVLLGRWIQTATANFLDLRSNGDASVDFSGLQVNIRDNGTYMSCTDNDANLCVSTPNLKCAFRYRIGGDQLYLQYRSGGEACESLRGQYQRQTNG
jgi:hypothetical protein